MNAALWHLIAFVKLDCPTKNAIARTRFTAHTQNLYNSAHLNNVESSGYGLFANNFQNEHFVLFRQLLL